MNKEIEYYEFTYKIPKYKIKSPLDFSKYYEIHKDEIIIDLQQENQELKKQLEDEIKLRNKILINCVKLRNQQKEFIEYLENLIKFYKNRDTYIVADILGSYDLNNIELELLEEILQKYEEIIGDDK